MQAEQVEADNTRIYCEGLAKTIPILRRETGTKWKADLLRKLLVVANIPFKAFVGRLFGERHFRQEAVLKPIELKVGPACGLAVMGMSGSGKSTLIQLLAGQRRATGGTLWLEEPRLTVSEIGAFMDPTLTLRKNLTSLGHNLNIDQELIRDRTEAVLALAELKDFADTALGILSKSASRILSLALGVELADSILIFDAKVPKASETLRENIYGRLRERIRDGLTVITECHTLNEAELFCNELIFLDQGELKLRGNLHEPEITAQVSEWLSKDTKAYSAIDGSDAQITDEGEDDDEFDEEELEEEEEVERIERRPAYILEMLDAGLKAVLHEYDQRRVSAYSLSNRLYVLWEGSEFEAGNSASKEELLKRFKAASQAENEARTLGLDALRKRIDETLEIEEVLHVVRKGRIVVNTRGHGQVLLTLGNAYTKPCDYPLELIREMAVAVSVSAHTESWHIEADTQPLKALGFSHISKQFNPHLQAEGSEGNRFAFSGCTQDPATLQDLLQKAISTEAQSDPRQCQLTSVEFNFEEEELSGLLPPYPRVSQKIVPDHASILRMHPESLKAVLVNRLIKKHKLEGHTEDVRDLLSAGIKLLRYKLEANEVWAETRDRKLHRLELKASEATQHATSRILESLAASLPEQVPPQEAIASKEADPSEASKLLSIVYEFNKNQILLRRQNGRVTLDKPADYQTWSPEHVLKEIGESPS